jgi:type I restriction enzyme, S subunit
LRPYITYKESGDVWIGKIPSGWSRKKLGLCVETIVPMRDKPTELKGDIPWIRIEDYNGKYIYDSKSKQGVSLEVIDEMNLKVFPVNTVITTCSCSFGTSMIVKKPLTSNQTFIGLFPDRNQLDEEFLYYQLHIWGEELDTLSSGSIQKYLSRDNFKSLKFIFPPLPEQTQIVSFLDNKTQKIDQLIDLTEKKIELLKTSISHYYFYRSVSIEFKETRDYWFQILPHSWKIMKFRDLFNVVSERNHPEERLLTVHQKKGVIFRDEQVQDVMNPSGDTSHYKLVQPGDFIISLRSSEGGFEYSDVRGLVSPVYTVLRPKFKIDNIFYKYLLKTENFITELNRYIKGIRDGKNINFSDVRDVPIPVPIECDENVSKQHRELFDSFEMLRKRIELLREYRQSLISEVVTGKIDVRDWKE